MVSGTELALVRGVALYLLCVKLATTILASPLGPSVPAQAPTEPSTAANRLLSPHTHLCPLACARPSLSLPKSLTIHPPCHWKRHERPSRHLEPSSLCPVSSCSALSPFHRPDFLFAPPCASKPCTAAEEPRSPRFSARTEQYVLTTVSVASLGISVSVRSTPYHAGTQALGSYGYRPTIHALRWDADSSALHSVG